MFKKSKDPRVIYVINKKTNEQVMLYGWVEEEKELFIISDAKTSNVYRHEFDTETYTWKYAKRKLFHL